jgi:hypothetical protein
MASTTLPESFDENATEEERRAAIVAGIRALADFVEARTDLPAPGSVHAQYSLPGVDPAHADFIRGVAARLGVEPAEDGSNVWYYLAEYPTSVRYVVHGLLRERETQDGAS